MPPVPKCNPWSIGLPPAATQSLPPAATQSLPPASEPLTSCDTPSSPWLAEQTPPAQPEADQSKHAPRPGGGRQEPTQSAQTHSQVISLESPIIQNEYQPHPMARSHTKRVSAYGPVVMGRLHQMSVSPTPWPGSEGTVYITAH